MLPDAPLSPYPPATIDAAPTGDQPAAVRTVAVVAIQLAYAHKVVIVPGHGLAAAQAQHQVTELTRQLRLRGTEVGHSPGGRACPGTSLGHGYAGIDNELYTHPRTGMLFADAKVKARLVFDLT